MAPRASFLGLLGVLGATCLAAGCAPAADDGAATDAPEIVSRCAVTAAMEPGTSSEPSRWTQGKDDWGSPGTHRAATGASGAGYGIQVREGNTYASLVLTEGASLRPGRYDLSFKVRTSKLDGGCASASSQWVEAGLKSGAFAREDMNEARWFTRAVVDDFGASCDRFASFTLGRPVELTRGGSLGVALKVGASGGGGIDATFDDVTLTCTGGDCMTCGTGGGNGGGGNGGGTTPGCETRGSLRACASSVEVAQDFDVSAGSDGKQRYATHERRPTRHDTVTLSNGAGVELTFLKTAMGARLYSAKARGAELLYTNPTPRVQSNWGQGGFPVFGGVESAWPVEEHGYYGHLAWESRLAWSAGAVAFIAEGTGASADGSPATVTITTTLAEGKESWTQRVELSGRPGAENMYYTNVMVDAGSKDRPADLEVIIPGLTRAQVHSRGDDDGFLPAGASSPSAEFDWPIHAGRDVSRMNTTIKSWLGMFVSSGSPRATRYGYFDHDRRRGLAVVATDGVGFYPKFFCGRGITADASASGKAYCEMWFSPNARTFWDHPTLAAATLVHEVRVVPFFERSAFDTAAR